MNRELDLLAELRVLLQRDPTETLCLSWWDRVLSVEAELALDPRSDEQEKKLLAQLRTAVSDLILAVQGGHEVHTSRAGVAISALESSIERRTTGEDGWPVRT